MGKKLIGKKGKETGRNKTQGEEKEMIKLWEFKDEHGQKTVSSRYCIIGKLRMVACHLGSHSY